MNKFEEAILKNDIKELNVLLDGYQYINIPNINGTTLLYKAILYNRIEIVELLLNKGAEINISNSDLFGAFESIGNNYIHMSKYPMDLANSDNKEVIKLLIKHGANVNFNYKENGLNGLYKAILDSDIEYAIFLLNHGANLEKTNDTYYGNNIENKNLNQLHKGKSAAELIFNENNLEIVKQFINNNGILNYFLCYSIQKGNDIISKFLIDVIENLNEKSNCFYRYPLTHAVNYQKIDIIDLLLKNNANPNIGCVLHEACKNQNLKIVKLLVENGADVNLIDNNGQTALFNAINAKNANKEIIRYLIGNGADIHKEDNNGISPLSFAESSKVSLVKILKEHVEIKLSENQDSNIVANYQNLLDKMVSQNKVINNLKDDVKSIKEKTNNNQILDDYKIQIDTFQKTILSLSNEIIELQNKLLKKEEDVKELINNFTSKINSLEEKIKKQKVVKTITPLLIPVEKPTINKTDGELIKRDSFDDF